ncbi:PREDICTED: probable serine/threonine-protein kinase At1g54610 [Populus euphratica]|uniref:Probable serine/threonine-protein kinase At1g54610 n=1 Tax=Populus euphratica TaxID=75702 RepID=A0AAJ6TS01_POPEU|nr:PREDICTED: probable serine/threonine-protein kinase At1g54610 [Populus euphratica]XP_011015816.1 PREDICTED: probable serine/threonine-protein kinase At1g54610 [Populus euphratica]
MGSICSKRAAEEDVNINKNERQIEVGKSSVQLVAPTIFIREEILVDVLGRKDARHLSKEHVGNVIVSLEGGGKKTKLVDEKKKGRHGSVAMDSESIDDQPRIISMMISMRPSAETEAWPQWLTAAAGEAVKGWLPRRADSFEKLDKIGQGTYSTVFKARDLETGKIVAMKKVRFVNMDPESVRFMAREIVILRRLDHLNVMKLEGIVTSRMSGSLYLVFEYMEHDLAGLAANPSIKYTEAQIKCYMQQLLRGLEHCHKHGVLHRDIKGSNLLINNDGVLKIADFGLATSYQPDQSLPLTSRVVTLWYRAPELLLGATEYGPAIDMWSAGCILAELFTGKPIMPGRTEVEQMHKIFKLCGSPSEAYWTKKKFPHATSFKPQQPYIRRIAETFKNFPPSALTLVDKLLSMEPQDRGSATSALRSEFFRIEPLPSDPSSLPKYPPSKELDAKMRDQEARRQKAEAVKGRGPESVRRGSGDTKKAPTSEFTAQGQPKTICSSYKYNIPEDGSSSFRFEPPRVSKKNSLKHSASVIHHSAVGLSLNKSVDCTENNPELRSNKSRMSQSGEISSSSLKKKERAPSIDSSAGFVPRKNRIHYSGPLMPPEGNMEEILKEHERQIQQAVRKARLEKSGTKDNLDVYKQLHHNR